jgi:2-amino-4-hydroxy-6-hydroxymethyldihydropteridine diphosphokinase
LAIAYLCLGSNLGDREENLRQALALLSPKADVEKLSAIYETEPVGYKEQPLFLNLVCRIATDLPPDELLRFVKKIETEMGRTLSFPNAPRIMDIDILLYEGTIMETRNLTIPEANSLQAGQEHCPISQRNQRTQGSAKAQRRIRCISYL